MKVIPEMYCVHSIRKIYIFIKCMLRQYFLYSNKMLFDQISFETTKIKNLFIINLKKVDDVCKVLTIPHLTLNL